MTNVYDLFFNPGEVAEIRALGIRGKSGAWRGFATGKGGKGVVSGYFDNPADFQLAVDALDRHGPKGVYFTVNPCKSQLLARAGNRLQAGLEVQTSDGDIDVLRWLLVDLDPKRPAGISSSDAELAVARDCARDIAVWLEDERGFAKGLRAISGNGYHLTYRLPDLANTDVNRALIQGTIQALDRRWSGPAVDVDTTVFNPARIWKCYGTTARKGDSTPDRPHRLAKLLPDGPKMLCDVPVTDPALLQQLIDDFPADPGDAGSTSPKAPTPASGSRSMGRSASGSRPMAGLGELDVGAYLSYYGREYTIKSKGAATLYILPECLFDPNHRGREAAICQSPNPPYLTYQCFHNSCKGRTWKDARQVISGDDAVAQFCAGYDPHWKPPEPAPSRFAEKPGPGRTATPPGPSPDKQKVPGGSGVTVGDGSAVPAPSDIDPMEFFRHGKRGAVFVPRYMANYFESLWGPIVHTDGQFWRYAAGVWAPFPRNQLIASGTVALGDAAQPQWIENAIKILAGLVNREENEWPETGPMINCLNGMVSLELLNDPEHALLPHDPKYGSRCQVPRRYDLEAECERWHRFMMEVFPGKNRFAKAHVLQQFFGYCLLPSARYEKALFCYGTGANGKSTALGVLEHMVGTENTSSLSIASLGMRFQSQFLQNKLVNIATETNTRDPLSTEIFKAVVSGDPITAEKKYGEPYMFRPYAKFVVAMNDTPVIPDKGHGFGRRLIVLDFPRRFTPAEMDPELPAKLDEEGDAIFLWALGGLNDLIQQKGFVVAEKVAAETKQFMEALNPLLIFAEEGCLRGPEQYVLSTELYKHYKAWCNDGGNRALSRNRFYDQILQQYSDVTKMMYGETRRVHFKGIGIKDEVAAAQAAADDR